jgi:hypothetical protein
MFSFGHSVARLCEGVTRREWLRVGGLSLLTAYVCVLLVRADLPDLVLEASAQASVVAAPAAAVAARSPVVRRQDG